MGLLVEAHARCRGPEDAGEPALDRDGFKRLVRDLDLWCSSCMVAFEGRDPVGVLLGAKRPDATLVTNVLDVLEAVGRIGEYDQPPPRGPEHRRDSLDEESALVLEAVPPRGSVAPEELAERAGLTLRTVLRRLSLLELAGLVERRDGEVLLARRAKATP